MTDTSAQPRSIESCIDVAVDANTAFAVFTDEIDCWWRQGAINFFDSARAHYLKMETRLGGRIIEVYDPESGDGLELGRITLWEPGSRLGWTSAVDDVEIEVRFEPRDSGTRITLTATIPVDGEDRGGTAWLRTIDWLVQWVARRNQVDHEPERLDRLAVILTYARPATAAKWLRDVFQLELVGGMPDNDHSGDHTWIEFRVGSTSVVVWGGGTGTVSDSVRPWIFVDDLESHIAHSRAQGAEIVADIARHGATTYEARDIEGHVWTFAQASPLMLGA